MTVEINNIFPNHIAIKNLNLLNFKVVGKDLKKTYSYIKINQSYKL